MKKRTVIIVFTIVSIFIMVLAAFYIYRMKSATTGVMETEEEPYKWSGWVVYWDYGGGMDELREYGGMVSEIVAFAAIFDINGDSILFLEQADDMIRLLHKNHGGTKSVYLSFTNDVQLEEGVYINKDTEILWRLLGTDEALDAHVEDLIGSAHGYGADGIEIDYEAIKRDEELWARFRLFVERLYSRCLNEDLLLRVVLGPFDADTGNFPEGPDYVIMCYNLHGPHSGPGPKADVAFLVQTFKRNRSLPGNVAMAFSNGGFSWDENGNCRAVTETRAIELLSEYGANAERDTASHSLSFGYETDEGVPVNVWFADRNTIEYWMGLACDYGYSSFAIWRLGGNDRGNLPFTGK